VYLFAQAIFNFVSYYYSIDIISRNRKEKNSLKDF